MARLAVALALAVAISLPARTAAAEPGMADGVVSVRSAFPMAESLARLKEAVAARGIRLFEAVDQTRLAAEAGVEIRPSTLLVFGNPRLGASFIAANPTAGLDWPVRLLVSEDADRQVWLHYTDFAWIARRHAIADRQAEFDTATRVIAAIAAAVTAR